MNRWLGPILALILLVLVGVGIWFSASDQLAERNRVQVVGLSGSEKLPFFKDERVVAEFAKHGLLVDVRKAGSRQIATHPELTKVDFAFPAGTPAAARIKSEHAKARTYTPFYTPMAIASWQPIAELLVQAGMATNKNGYYVLNMHAYLDAIRREQRWVDLPGNKEYASSKQLYVKTTDVRKSNSAAMFMALMSYLMNQDKVPTSDSDLQHLFPLIQDVFLKQGFVENSSQVPFDDYLVMGMGHTPLLFVYEAQYIGAAHPETGGLPRHAVLIYPQPGLFSKHVLLAFTEAGNRVGELLTNDARLKELANEYGFRNNQRQYFSDYVSKLGVTLAPDFIDMIEPPSYETMEKMITRIEAAY